MRTLFPKAVSLSACGWALAASLAGCAGSQAVTRPEGDQTAPPSAGATGGVPDVSPRAQVLFDDALKAFEAQKKAGRFDYPSLERKFQAALSADGRLAEAEYNLGVLAERQGKKDEAVKHYRSALKRKPSLKEASDNLAVISLNAGDTPTAVGIYQDTLKIHPDDAVARARLAEIYRQNGEHDRAMDFARQALSKDPKTLGAYKVMMRSYADRKQLSMAKLVALRAMKIDERDPELYHTVGLLLLQENDAPKARAQFRKAVEVRPDYQPSHLILAKMALRNEDYAGAEEHLRRILQTDGKNAEALLNLGVAYKGLGQYDKAMQAYDQAEKLNPELAPIYFNRGVILHKVKDAPERGLEFYRKYLAMAGEAALPADAPVFALMKEAEQVIMAKAEAKEAEEQAKRMEAAEKAQQDRLKAADDKEKKERPAAAATGKEAEEELEKAIPAQGGEAPKPSAKKQAAKAAPGKAAKSARAEPPSDEPSDIP